MKYEFNKQVQLLLVTQSDDKVKMVYINNGFWQARMFCPVVNH
jgi:hypothetical protein